MAKAKSPTGKTNRATNNIKDQIKDQAATANPVIPDGNPIAASAAAPAPAPVKEVQPEVSEVKAAAPEAKKFELHKNDSRQSDARQNDPRNKVVPINVDEEIRRRAYELSQQRGQGTGSPAEDWLAAEREVMQRYRQQRA
jgi:hypothetical protein